MRLALNPPNAACRLRLPADNGLTVPDDVTFATEGDVVPNIAAEEASDCEPSDSDAVAAIRPCWKTPEHRIWLSVVVATDAAAAAG
jgi:hypothetical protein